MEENSRILILTTAYLPQMGGSELAIKNITDRLPEFNFDLITSRFSQNVSAHEKIGNVNVYRVGNSLSRFSFLLPKNFLPVAVFFKARKLISQHGQYRLIHAYQASQAAGGGWLLKWFYPRIPFLVTVQEGKVLTAQSWLIKLFRYLIFKKADKVTAISNYLARYIASQNKNLPVAIIPNGVNTSPLGFNKNEKAIQDMKNELGLKSNKVVISVSRLVGKNGLEDLIKAMAYIRDNYPEPVDLLIAGDAEAGISIKSKLEKLTKDLNLESTIRFVGGVSNEEVYRYLSLVADVFVRPSYSEGLGTAFLEAMAVGVPIVGTKIGGIPDFLKDGETGLFCNVGDSEDIGRKIVRILSDQELHDKLAKQGRELVMREYDWNIIADKFRNLYETITKN